MKKYVLKLTALLLSIMLAGVLIPATAFAEEILSGKCGDNLTWTLENGVLKISGTGPMYDLDVIHVDEWGLLWTSFEAEQQLRIIELEDGVTSIGNHAFNHCHNLKSVTIPGSVTLIGESAFSSCENLTSVTIPNSVVSIGRSIFANCSNLKSVILPNSVTAIENMAFYQCRSLSSIIIPDSVISIGEWAFAGCLTLNDITFEGMTVPNINPYSFYDSYSVRSRLGYQGAVHYPVDAENAYQDILARMGLDEAPYDWQAIANIVTGSAPEPPTPLPIPYRLLLSSITIITAMTTIAANKGLPW